MFKSIKRRWMSSSLIDKIWLFALVGGSLIFMSIILIFSDTEELKMPEKEVSEEKPELMM